MCTVQDSKLELTITLLEIYYSYLELFFKLPQINGLGAKTVKTLILQVQFNFSGKKDYNKSASGAFRYKFQVNGI